MIAAIEGTVEFAGEKFLVLNAGAVSYRVFVPPDILSKIPEKGRKIKIWTHLYQREDTQELYGFFAYPELEFFEMLIQISGIGPKSGLGIMAVAPLDQLKKAIAAGDATYLTKVSGIGRKTAEKIILELREKMAGRSTVDAPDLKEESDALDALLALGYTAAEAREALQKIPADIMRASDRVKAALQRLGSSGQ